MGTISRITREHRLGSGGNYVLAYDTTVTAMSQSDPAGLADKILTAGQRTVTNQVSEVTYSN